MLNQVLRKKKMMRARRARQDYERRRNINNNVPSVLMIEKVPKYKTLPFPRDKYHKITDRRPQVVLDTYKNVPRKVKKPRYHEKGEPSYVFKRDGHKREVPMIPYPPRKK